MLSSGQGHMLEVLCLLATWPMLRSRSACTDTQRSRRTRKQRAHAQVAHLFARALVVVAPHGGTLANLMFAAASRARAEDDGVCVCVCVCVCVRVCVRARRCVCVWLVVRTHACKHACTHVDID